MKIFSLLLLVTFVLFSCKQEDPPLFVIPVANLSFEISAADNPLATHYLMIRDVRIHALDVIASKNLDTAAVKSILPGSARLYAAFGEAELDFLNIVNVRICPAGSDVSQKCGTAIFYNDRVPLNAGFDLDLFPENVSDIRNIVFQDKVDIQVILERFKEYPPATFSPRLDLEFAVR